MIDRSEFIERLEGFIKEWNDKVRPYWEANFTHSEYKPITYTKGRKYAKLVQNGSVVAFIDMSNGDIYKPAGWKAPAKHVRGNIFSPEGGFEATYGAEGGHCFIRYLK